MYLCVCVCLCSCIHEWGDSWGGDSVTHRGYCWHYPSTFSVTLFIAHASSHFSLTIACYQRCGPASLLVAAEDLGHRDLGSKELDHRYWSWLPADSVPFCSISSFTLLLPRPPLLPGTRDFSYFLKTRKTYYWEPEQLELTEKRGSWKNKLLVFLAKHSSTNNTVL